MNYFNINSSLQKINLALSVMKIFIAIIEIIYYDK